MNSTGLFSEKNLKIFTKIILFYSIFYICLRIFSIIRGAWLEANLILSLPFIIFFALGTYILNKKNYSWIYAFAGFSVIVLMRIFETQWVITLQELFE